MSIRIKKHCSVCNKELKYKNENGLCKKCYLNSEFNKPTEATKKIISEKRKEYLKNNPDKHPWRYHTKFKSVPCELLKAWLRDNNIQFIEEYQPLFDNNIFYSIDIAFPDKLIGIEINGNQHYNKDGSLKPYYQKRHDILSNANWILYEMHYSMCYHIDQFKELLMNIVSSDKKIEFDYTVYKKSIKKYYCSCGSEIGRVSKYCISCSRLKSRKIVWPTKETLQLLFNEFSMISIGKKFGVSDCTVKRWCKHYGISKPINVSQRSEKIIKMGPFHRPRKVVWPSKEELTELIKTTPYVQIGKKFGVSDNAVRKWCKHYRIGKYGALTGTPTQNKALEEPCDMQFHYQSII